MTEFAGDVRAQQTVNDSAALLSGQELPNNPDGAPPEGMPLIKAWAREVQGIIRFWQSYLSADRDKPIDLIEISGVKTSMQSLREGLICYLFERRAKLRSIEPDAWEGIQEYWILIKMNSDTLWDEIVYYRDWMAQIEMRGEQITSGIEMRRMARQMRDDTRTIVSLYNRLADNLLPVIKEILLFPQAI